MENKEVNKKLKEEISKLKKAISEDGIQEGNNLEYLYKIVDIEKDICEIEKEDDNMNYGYGNYSGRGPGHGSYGDYDRGSYGRYDNYGARGRDMKYRGDEELDRMAGEYGRYMESRSRYGAGEETDKSFHYMVKALEDFIKVLYEEAEGQQQKQMLRDALQRSMM